MGKYLLSSMLKLQCVGVIALNIMNHMLQVACNGYTWRQKPAGERLGPQWYCLITKTYY